MSELKPCPFCGGEPVLTQHGNNDTRKRGTEIKCPACFVVHKVYAIRNTLDWTTEQAIERWNARSDHTDRVAKVFQEKMTEHGKGLVVKK